MGGLNFQRLECVQTSNFKLLKVDAVGGGGGGGLVLEIESTK